MYRYEPIILTKDEKDNLIITEDKLKQLLIEAYNQGYSDGSNNNIQPSPTPYDPYKTPSFWYDKFYCICTSDDIKIN